MQEIEMGKQFLKERPILFSSAMIRALLENRKTQTRRLIKIGDKLWDFPLKVDAIAPGMLDRCKFGKVGDRLWVREKIYCFNGRTLPKSQPDDFSNLQHYGCDYATNIEDSDLSTATKTISPIHMPRWCCRIELELTEVSIERVGDISPVDAIAEGLKVKSINGQSRYGLASWKDADYTGIPQVAFSRLWDGINAHSGSRFGDDPWVWVLKFNRIM